MKKAILTFRLTFYIVSFFGIGQLATGQVVYHALPEGQVMNAMLRSSGGSYYLWKETSIGVEVSKYDPQMTAIWKRIIDLTPSITYWGTQTWTTTSAVRTPDDGLCIVGVGNYPQTLVIFKVSYQGDLAWQRTISIPSNGWDGAQLHGSYWHDIEIDETGEIIIKMVENFWGGSRILKLNAQGEPVWLVRNSSQYGIIRSILPDKNGGCFFAVSYSGGDYYQKVSIGHLDPNGSLTWHDRFTWPTAFEVFGYRLRYGVNGSIVLGGKDDGDLFALQLEPDGSPLGLKYYYPDVPYSDCPEIWLYGFESALDGRTAFIANHLTQNDAFLLILDEDGNYIKARKLPWNIPSGDWYGSYRPTGLDALANELSIPLQYLRIWNPSTIFTTTMVQITSPFEPDGLCHFDPMGFTQSNVPLEGIVIEQINEMTQMALPTSQLFNAMSITTDPISSVLHCGTVHVEPLMPTLTERMLSRTLLDRGELVFWRTGVAATVLIYDANGRLVSTFKGTDTFMSTSHLTAGVYRIVFLTLDDTRLSTEHFVIQ